MAQANIKTVNTGGGCMVDVITLKSGAVIVVNDEYVGAYESEEAFWGDEGIAMLGSYVDGDDTLHSLQCYRAEMVSAIPDGDAARNWPFWDELGMIDEAITAAVFNEHFEGVGAGDICTTGQSADLATAMAARRIQLDSEA